MKKVIFDLDDLSNKYDCFDQLVKLKKQIPNLKVTLFTIPGRTNMKLLDKCKMQDWIELAIHGIYHDSNFEFAKKTYEQAYYKIWKACDPNYYTKGFRAPGWQISTATMEALKDLGFWVAIQYSDGRFEGHPDGPHQPKVIENLPYYDLKEPDDEVIKIHGHTWNVCGNGLKDLIPTLRKYADSEFIFIDNYVKGKISKKL